jgi:4-hydroxyphenylpyruvate dioxygenase
VTRSIATVCLSGTLPDKLEAAAAAGFDAVEIFEQDLLTFDGTPDAAGALCRDLGLAVALYQPFRDFEAMPEPARAKNLDRAERKFDIMAALGAPLVLVCSNTQAAALDEPQRAADDLAEMARRAAARGLRVGYEALAWGRHVNRWRQAWEIARRADHPALGLILDSFHTLALGDTLDGLAGTVPAEKLFFVQLADAPRLAMDPLSWSRHHRLFPGQGELPVAAFLRAALDAGYAGALSLEIFNDEFRAAPARRIARDALRSLVWLEDAAGIAPLPALPRLSGVEFVEFALDHPARERLGGFLGGFGFRRAGLHRSKDVELWRHGAVNLVLNAEPDSAAAERFAIHGAAVCAMGLRVDDATRLVARAEALRVPAFRERLGPGERAIPALRAPDGTLVYLIEDGAAPIWDDDFVLDALPPGAAPLAGVDHIAQALDPGLLDGFALFWRAVFGLEPDPLWELPDPYGLVRSRAFVSQGGAVRIPLNASESGRTATGRFVSAFAGAGVHHLAFTARDAAATLDAMPEPALLRLPRNAFDDLAARFALDDAARDALAARQLLTDRDAQGGSFRHAYSRSFDDRFFLEICERRDGYAGFGAANAGVRLAAQRAAR